MGFEFSTIQRSGRGVHGLWGSWFRVYVVIEPAFDIPYDVDDVCRFMTYLVLEG